MQRASTRTRLILALISIGVLLLTTACGGSAAPTATTAPTTLPTTAPTQANPTSAGGTASAAPATASAQPTAISVTDIVGRKVTVKAPAQRIILGEGRQTYIMALLDNDNPFKRVVGWRDDLLKNDLDTYNKYKAKFPQITSIPLFGDPTSGGSSVEAAIAAKPDVVVWNLDVYQSDKGAGLIDQLAKAGIPSVVIDYRLYPLENTVPSTLLMAQIMGKQERAQTFVNFYLQQINTVYARIDKITGPKPTVFMYRAPGNADCCGTFGRGNLGLLLERAGGKNIAADLLPGWSGTLNPEQVIAANPDAIIVTGSNWVNAFPPGSTFVSLGYGTSPETARQQLQTLMEKSHWTTLTSVQNQQVYAIWHQFYNSPYQFIALEQFAKWLYPEQFKDINPEQVFKEFHDQFLPIEYSGTFWISLKP